MVPEIFFKIQPHGVLYKITTKNMRHYSLAMHKSIMVPAKFYIIHDTSEKTGKLFYIEKIGT